MLVLSRKPGESFYLNPDKPDQVEVKILESSPGRVRVGINAPEDVLILREELLRKVGGPEKE